MQKSNVLWKLFLSTLYISAFTFGGGFVIVTFMKRKFVDELQWIGLGLFAAALVILRWKKWSPILVMVLCGGIYLAVNLLPGAI